MQIKTPALIYTYSLTFLCEPEFNSREAEVSNSKALISETLESPRKSELWIMIV